MINPNTPAFWDLKVKSDRKLLEASSIYSEKNKIVTSWLKAKEGKLLNIGVGYGLLEEKLVKNQSKLELYGVDISKKAIRGIKRKVKGEYVVSSALDLPFKKSFFSYILALDVLEHFSESELKKVLHEVYRVLKAGGTFIVSVPINETNSDYKANRHMKRYSVISLVSTLSNNGFKVQSTRTLYAFKKLYNFKSLLVRAFGISFLRPNLVIAICLKK